MQCNAIKGKDMIGKHLSNHNKQGSQENDSRIILAWSVSNKKCD